MPTLFGRAEDEKIGLGRSLSTEGGSWKVVDCGGASSFRPFLCVLVLAHSTADDPISSIVPRERPYFVFPKKIPPLV